MYVLALFVFLLSNKNFVEKRIHLKFVLLKIFVYWHAERFLILNSSFILCIVVSTVAILYSEKGLNCEIVVNKNHLKVSCVVIENKLNFHNLGKQTNLRVTLANTDENFLECML